MRVSYHHNGWVISVPLWLALPCYVVIGVAMVAWWLLRVLAWLVVHGVKAIAQMYQGWREHRQ